MLKKDFPIFENNPGLIYLDSTASSQKPKYVIDGISDYLSSNYSNIHRWMYDISVNSEKMYFDSKKKVATLLWVSDFREIIYTYNSTYALNLLTQTLRYNKVLKAWDKVLLSITEHHANIVPWLILKDEIWIELEFVNTKDDFSLDIEDFKNKLDKKVKVVSLTQVSNVTGEIYDLEKVWKILTSPQPSPAGEGAKNRPLFIIDASQSVPHFSIDVEKLWADFVFFTWHKIMADSGIWVLWWKKELLEKYESVFSGWWAINNVSKTCFTSNELPFKFEPGTPNMSGAVSLLKAIEYIENIWGFEKIEEIEDELVEFTLEKFKKFPQIKLIWGKNKNSRVWVFSFTVDWIHPSDIADEMADNNICIRSGQHCTEPFMNFIWEKFVCRMSLYIYNTREDIDKFFEVLEGMI